MGTIARMRHAIRRRKVGVKIEAISDNCTFAVHTYRNDQLRNDHNFSKSMAETYNGHVVRLYLSTILGMAIFLSTEHTISVLFEKGSELLDFEELDQSGQHISKTRA